MSTNYALTSAACATCHLATYNSTTNPNHVTAGFPTDCSLCHTTVNWLGATFNHATTGFALTGTHLTTPCAQCHVNNNYALTSAACATCHLATYNTTTNQTTPPQGSRRTVRYATPQSTGLARHSTTARRRSLSPALNITVPCTSCHINNVFAGTPTDLL